MSPIGRRPVLRRACHHTERGPRRRVDPFGMQVMTMQPADEPTHILQTPTRMIHCNHFDAPTRHGSKQLHNPSESRLPQRYRNEGFVRRRSRRSLGWPANSTDSFPSSWGRRTICPILHGMPGWEPRQPLSQPCVFKVCWILACNSGCIVPIHCVIPVTFAWASCGCARIRLCPAGVS